MTKERAKNYNPVTINIDVTTNSILSSGGGISEKTKADGTTHVSVYSTTENRHLSYDKDGNISNGIQIKIIVLIWTTKVASKKDVVFLLET